MMPHGSVAYCRRAVPVFLEFSSGHYFLSWLLPGLFDAQPLLAALDGAFANLQDDRDTVATAVWLDMRVVKRGFRRERLVAGQLV